MKNELHPGVAIGIVVVLIVVVVIVLLRSTGGGRVDRAADMSPELRAKLGAVYGGAQRASSPTGRAAPTQGKP
jgi:hypothetical protein